MLGSVRDASPGQWSVLVMDSLTTRVMSHVVGISDILDYGVSRACRHFEQLLFAAVNATAAVDSCSSGGSCCCGSIALL